MLGLATEGHTEPVRIDRIGRRFSSGRDEIAGRAGGQLAAATRNPADGARGLIDSTQALIEAAMLVSHQQVMDHRGKSIVGEELDREGLGRSTIPEPPVDSVQGGPVLERTQDAAGALAEYQLVLKNDPDNPKARAAVDRLTRR